MSLVVGSPAGCPARSLSVSKASLTAGQTKPFSITGRGDVRHARLRRLVEVLQPGADSLAAQRLGQPLRRAVALGDQHDPPVLGQPGPHVGEHAGRIAAVGGGQGCIDAERNAVAALRPRSRAARGERLSLARAHRSRRTARSSTRAGPARPRPRGSARSAGTPRIPRSMGASPPDRGVDPGRLEELLAGPDQVVGAGPDPFGIAGQHDAARRHVVEQQVHPVGQDGRERLHALDRDALGQLAEDVGQRGMGRRRVPWPGP